jgi:glucose/arabinose dehydrogenase
MERTGRNTGQMVVFVPMHRDESGAYATSKWQPFITFDTTLFDYSPIDVTAGPDGAMYLAEWTTSTLFRIFYEKGL